MQTKCIMVFQLSTNTADPTATQRRIGGWTETYYWPTQNLNDAKTAFRSLCQLRAGLLPRGALVKGQRYQFVNPVGASVSEAFNYPGTASLDQDVPQIALHFRIPAQAAQNVRSLDLRGVPDARVVGGEYSGTQNYDGALSRLLRALPAWQFYGRDLSQPTFPIYSIDPTGAAIIQAAFPYVVGDMVRVLRSLDSTGDFQGGLFRVASTTLPFGLTLQGWTGGACKGGKIRKDGHVFVNFSDINQGADTGFGSVVSFPTPIAIIKKVGRPSGGYRGRRSRSK
jgi:hypothetical protein